MLDVDILATIKWNNLSKCEILILWHPLTVTIHDKNHKKTNGNKTF